MRLPSPIKVLAFLTSSGLHIGLFAFALSGGAPQGLPDGQVLLTVDIVSQEQATSLSRDESQRPDLAPREDSQMPDSRETAKDDRDPVLVAGESPLLPSPSDEAKVIGSDESSFVVAQGLDDAFATLPTASREPDRPKKPKVGTKASLAGQRSRRRADQRSKPDVARTDSKSASDTAPEALPSPGDDAARLASRGAPVRNAPFFPPSMRDGLIGLLQQQIERCYATPSGASKRVVLPVVGIRLERNGRLAENPRIVRSGRTPVDLALAQAALAAVRRCAPYKIPATYAPYYDTWKDIVAEFEFSGS